MMQILDAGIGPRARRGAAGAGRDDTLIVSQRQRRRAFFKNLALCRTQFDLLEGDCAGAQICRCPGISRRTVSDQVASTMDLTATCLASGRVASAADYPPTAQSVAVLTGGAENSERTLYWRMRNAISGRCGAAAGNT